MNLNAVLILQVVLLGLAPLMLAMVLLASVWGIKPLLRQLLDEQRKTNALLESQRQHQRQGITDLASR